MRRKLFAILLCLTVVAGVLPLGVWAAGTGHQAHCICGLDTAAEKSHAHGKVTEWVGITSLDEISTEHTYYYLKNNVVTVASWKPVSGTVLCLNGYSVTCDADADTVKIEEESSFTLTDCSADESGRITHTSGKNGRGVENRGTFNLWRGGISGNSVKSVGAGVCNGGLDIPDATFNMYGGRVSDNSTGDYGQGAGIYNRSKVNLSGGSISDNYATGSGGGISNYRGTVKMSGTASIRNNRIDPENTSSSGGGIDNYLGTLIMEGGEISGNKANCGGGVGNTASSYSSADTTSGSFTMTGGAIFDNEADAVGGGIYNSADEAATLTVTLTGSAVIRDNKAKNGGGVGIGGSAAVTLSGNAEVKGNTAASTEADKGNGGGVFNSDGQLGTPVFKQEGGSISGNTARRGGGIYVSRGKWNASGGSVTGNTASLGGGVHMGRSDTITLSGSVRVTGNKTEADGEANNLYLTRSDFRVLAAGLTDGAKIGVTTASAPSAEETLTITGDTVTKNYFVSDNAAYETSIDANGYVVLGMRTEKSFTVKINLPADGSASPADDTGDLEQTVKADGRYRAVRVNADSTHYFSNDNIKEIRAMLEGSGIYLATQAESESIVITGTPQQDVEITLVTTGKRSHSAPRVWGEAPQTADGEGYINTNEVKYALEYRRQGTEEWLDFGGLVYHAVEAGYTYEVRYKGTLADLASPISTCFVPSYSVPTVAEPTPGSYTYDGAEHTGIVLGDDYVVSSGSNTATDAGTYTVSVKPAAGKQWEDGSTNAREFSWKIEKADRKAPAGLAAVRPTVLGASDGKITGVTADMEYRKAGDSAWIACTGSEIAGLAAGSYEVRYKEAANYNAGEALGVTVQEGDAPAYRVVEGADGAWAKDSDKTLSFRVNNDLSGCIGIQVDGETIASDKYTVSDSGVITLEKAYLAGLAVGRHTLTVVYGDGACSASFEIQADASHTHSYGTEWKSDKTNHWHECSCGDRSDEAAHTFVWKVDKAATKTEAGLKHEECSACGAKRSENTVIEKLSDDSSKNTGSTGNESTGSSENAGSKDSGTSGSVGSNTSNSSFDSGNAGAKSGDNAIFPKTGDAGTFLWIALLFISGGAVVGTTLISKKRQDGR